MFSRRDFLVSAAALAAPLFRTSTRGSFASATQDDPVHVPGALPAAVPRPNVSEPAAEMFEDFESGGYDGWSLEGNWWGTAPASGEALGLKVTGFEGKRFLCSLHPVLGPRATGRAVSREFRIERPFVAFLIGGGQFPNETCMNLGVDGATVLTATGEDIPELRSVSWDVSGLRGKTAHFEVVDAVRNAARGYVMVDSIRLLDGPPFRELVSGQGRFFCFATEDSAGREFQRLFLGPDGQIRRAAIDLCVDRVTEALADSAGRVDRNNPRSCQTLLRAELGRVLLRYRVSDPLAQQLIAANACSALTALLTKYDDDLALFIAERSGQDLDAYNYAVEMRDPATVLKRGKAVCGGIAALEQYLAASVKELGIECLVVNGHTRRRDDTPQPTINHSWTMYHFGGSGLWAPSDTTRALTVMPARRTLPKAKLVRSSILLIDPLLRDLFALHHFARECRVGHPGVYVNNRVVNLISREEWAAFHEAHPYLLRSARAMLAQLDKEDAARLAGV